MNFSAVNKVVFHVYDSIGLVPEKGRETVQSLRCLLANAVVLSAGCLRAARSLDMRSWSSWLGMGEGHESGRQALMIKVDLPTPSHLSTSPLPFKSDCVEVTIPNRHSITGQRGGQSRKRQREKFAKSSGSLDGQFLELNSLTGIPMTYPLLSSVQFLILSSTIRKKKKAWLELLGMLAHNTTSLLPHSWNCFFFPPWPSVVCLSDEVEGEEAPWTLKCEHHVSPLALRQEPPPSPPQSQSTDSLISWPSPPTPLPVETWRLLNALKSPLN